MSLKKFFRGNWLLLLVLLFALMIRLYRLPSLITFGGDQGIDLLAVKKMIVDHKWTLLGPKTSTFSVYNGPFYYYLVLPVLYLARLNPISVSYFMVFLWIFSFIFIYLLAKDLFGKSAALISVFLFSVWPVSIEYSRVSFNSFPTPFFSALFLYGIWKFYHDGKFWGLAVAGICSGIMMQLHYFNFFLIFLTLLILFFKKEIKLKEFSLFILFGVISFSPMILFELRHHFFNTRTLVNSFFQGGISQFSWKLHYLIAFFPVFFIAIGAFFNFMIKKNKILGLILILVLAFYSIRGIDLQRDHGFTMPNGWNYLGVKKASEIIAADAEGSFNVAAILDGDTRAYPYRYIIEVAGKSPKDVDEYTNLKNLYVVARGDEKEVLNYPVWEIQTFLPAKVDKIWEIQNGIKVFKLEKEKIVKR